MDYNGHKVIFDGQEMFVILIMEIDSWVYTYVKTDQAIHFKYVPFHVLQLYLDESEKIF